MAGKAAKGQTADKSLDMRKEEPATISFSLWLTVFLNFEVKGIDRGILHPEVTRGKPAIPPNNSLGLLQDLRMEPLKLSIQKNDFKLLVPHFAAQGYLIALSKERAEVENTAQFSLSLSLKALKKWLKEHWKCWHAFLSWPVYTFLFWSIITEI